MKNSHSNTKLGWRSAFFALGGKSMPSTVALPKGQFEHIETFKHDFFAATGLYQGPGHHQVVVKIYRSGSLMGLPLGWAGRWMTARETRHYQALSHVTGIPAFEARLNKYCLVHRYIPGRPLRRDDKVTDQFFDQLAQILEDIHHCGMAYVDLDKSENILLGDDQRPYLIDFQISWQVRPGWLAGSWLSRSLLTRLQKEDWYHFRKHKRRLRRDLLTETEAKLAYRKSFWITAHRIIARPYFIIRRWLLKRLTLPPAS